MNSLRQGDIDVFIGGALRDPAPTNDIVQEVLFDDEAVIVGNAQHPLRGRKNLSSADLLHFPWIVPSHGVPMRSNWERMFRSQGVEPPQVRIECGSMLITRGLMLNGRWLTLMSRDQIRISARRACWPRSKHPARSYADASCSRGAMTGTRHRCKRTWLIWHIGSPSAERPVKAEHHCSQPR